ncbi:1-phosphatidylinositol 4,5-bisphosphate phosphodiesterase gamma-1-like isoform X2 [Oppia nitens]|uniref:1-phosphatidylinositol 4,5-bisphosphate phosphodiesterase gamma-1-like isoform X2 n=1 Tax=Oppia nitens TaxID=1686743 RepID=UPI0023DA3876|nr:1-phosphatidylinositol 4,5-bisphosphate phosphodiesterase gamma-1-like isoform X2 [Oppia nitens]
MNGSRSGHLTSTFTVSDKMWRKEMSAIIQRLENGLVLAKFFNKAKPERRKFAVKLKTRQLIWTDPQKSTIEGIIDLREVKEVRIGPINKIMDRMLEEDPLKGYQKQQCLSVLYGQTFRLKTLSCAAKTASECEQWVHGLRFLATDTQRATHWLQLEFWITKEFSLTEKSAITLKEVKAFLTRNNYKLANNKLKEHFQEVDKTRSGEIGYDGFMQLYHNLIYDNKIFCEYFASYSNDRKLITAQELAEFIANEQNDIINSDLESVQNLMNDFLNQSRDLKEVYFTVKQFINYLFSKHNEIWDSKHNDVNQDMDRPLTHYWIASSHNTYLTGDQVKSESSTDAYARCLRMGCRCIELDCWDGPDGKPLIYHGHTLTTKIKFFDVIKTINEHAFTTSDFPVILSIENHCTLPQQRYMAQAFKDIFGDLLLTQPIEKEGIAMPSPNKLKRKFIIKHKKLPEGSDERFIQTKSTEDIITDMDISNSVKNGILFLEDSLEREWKPHFFMLTNDKMYYTENDHNSEEDDDIENERHNNVNQRDGTLIGAEELHLDEKWFHGKLAGGRNQAESLLNRYSHLGDGTFLVRDSDTFVGDYSLSFWRKGKVNHCRIKQKQEKRGIKYHLIDSVTFDTLYALITHYQTHPLRSQEFSITLTEPVPQPNSHESKEWYHQNMTRAQAEDMLKRLRYDGAFLVRPSEKEENSFSISFRAENKIKHCRIKHEGRLYLIGNAQYESLVDLINFYEKHPLYRKVKLKYPTNEEIVRRIGSDPIGPEGNYMDPNNSLTVTVKALYDYRAQREDELSFCKHAIITNVIKLEGGGWWKGDYGGKKQHWLPANHVEEVNTHDNIEDLSDVSKPFGNLQKGSIDIVGCTVIPKGTFRGRDYVFSVVSPTQTAIFLSTQCEDEMIEWVTKIRETSQMFNEMIRHNQKIERDWRIAQELSNLIIYCRAVSFDTEKIGNFTEMSSFPESKVDKWLSPMNCQFLLKYNKTQFTRVYPKGGRIDSSNYDPMKMWLIGIQMAALNYQTPDRAMQLNGAMFRSNGKCGYVLKSDIMFDDNFNSYDRSTIKNIQPITLTVKVIAARHLMKSGRGLVSPFVEVEIIGTEFDANKSKTSSIPDNGFNPVWNETIVFDISCSDLAFLRLVVYDEDMFGDPNFLGHGTFPINCIRTGYRSVPLMNEYSEELELASLLIHISIKTIQSEDPIYSSIQELRDSSRNLNRMIVNAEKVGDSSQAQHFRVQLGQIEEQLININEERMKNSINGSL